MTAGRRDAHALHELPEAGLAQGIGSGASPEKNSARSEAYVGFPYAGVWHRFNLCLKPARAREPVDYVEDIFALGAVTAFFRKHLKRPNS